MNRKVAQFYVVSHINELGETQFIADGGGWVSQKSQVIRRPNFKKRLIFEYFNGGEGGGGDLSNDNTSLKSPSHFWIFPRLYTRWFYILRGPGGGVRLNRSPRVGMPTMNKY